MESIKDKSKLLKIKFIKKNLNESIVRSIKFKIFYKTS